MQGVDCSFELRQAVYCLVTPEETKNGSDKKVRRQAICTWGSVFLQLHAGLQDVPVTERPNLVLCLFDSLTAAAGGMAENSIDLPVLSNLRSNGVCFSRTYTPCPVSSPARASVFTGLDPVAHGLWANGVTLPDYEHTFVQRLAHAGYSNYLAGRYQLSGVSRWTTEHARPDEYGQMDWAHGPLHRSRQNAYLKWLQTKSPDLYSTIFPVQADPDNMTATEPQRDALTALPGSLSFNHFVGERVGEWIESQPSDRPFLAVASFCVGDMLGTQPHPSTDVEGLNVLALQQADAAIGRILGQLESSLRSRDTVIVIAAARGNTDSPEEGCALNEQAIRVPLIINGPAFKPHTVEGLVSTMDIAPTLLAIANVPCGPRTQGESLLDVLEGNSTTRAWGLSRVRDSLVAEEGNWQTAFYTRNMKLIVSHGQQPANRLRLFDLDADPLEKYDLAGSKSHAAQLEQLMDQMIDARCALEDRTEPRIAEF